jgi:hypothetical protein
MSDALAPAIAGEVVQPSAMISGKDEALHSFAGVIRDLVLRGGAYHTENDQDAALNSVSKYVAASLAPSVMAALNNEHPGAAAKEDVTQRVPPSGIFIAPVPVNNQPIDYNKLAAAIVAAQAAQAMPADSEE